MDRVSRQVVRKAARTIEDIVDAGITLVDLSDGAREYSAAALDSDPTLFLMMALRFMRANEESALKGSRVALAYRSKRTSFAGSQALDKPYTRRLPAWMRWNDKRNEYEIISDRGALVREMFELTDAGWGQHRIARMLNERGVETWGAGGWKAMYWHRSYVRKILSNRATIGVFTPHLSTKDPIRDARRASRLRPLSTVCLRLWAVSCSSGLAAAWRPPLPGAVIRAGSHVQSSQAC